MASASLTRRFKAIDTRAYLHSSIGRMASGAGQIIPVPRCGQQRTAPESIAKSVFVPSWATAVAMALLVAVGALAFEMFVLWVASFTVIERLPF